MIFKRWDTCKGGQTSLDLSLKNSPDTWASVSIEAIVLRYYEETWWTPSSENPCKVFKLLQDLPAASRTTLKPRLIVIWAIAMYMELSSSSEETSEHAEFDAVGEKPHTLKSSDAWASVSILLRICLNYSVETQWTLSSENLLEGVQFQSNLQQYLPFYMNWETTCNGWWCWRKPQNPRFFRCTGFSFHSIEEMFGLLRGNLVNT